MNSTIKLSLLLILLSAPLRLCVSSPIAASDSTPNVLFIAIDDLRLGCYLDETALTPHIDRLASRGTTFGRAYCQEAVCCPSRLSLLTGLRPDTIKVWDLATHFREAVPNAVTLPQHFKNHGYHTQSIGKILHGSGKPSKDAPSWSVDPVYDVSRDPKLRYANPGNQKGKGLKRAASEAGDVDDDHYTDGVVCNLAIQAIDELAKQEKPFFLAVGFRKPHLPFCAPKKYWDLYDRDDIPRPASTSNPKGAPELAVRSWRELEGYSDIPKDGKISAERIQELRHGYYACVSYVDALVGRLLRKINDTPLPHDTVICLWGDHGFHLGEQGLWTKANNYELSTRVPLIVALPGRADFGMTTNAFVELVDIYPTLAEVCNLPVPNGLEGTSFAPLLSTPGLPWKSAAFSQYPRAREGNRHKIHGDIMGYTVRTKNFRYVEWRQWKSGETVARELYDHRKDDLEMFNLAGHEAHAPEVERHAALLRKGWKAALPPR